MALLHSVEMHAAIYALVSVVFAAQLIGASRTFRPVLGSRMGILSVPVPLAFAVILFRIRSIELNLWMAAPGCVAQVAALALFVWAGRAVGGRYFSYIFSDDRPRFLCTEGPFAHVRNPFYTSYLLAYGSAVAMFPDAVSFVIVAGMIVYYHAAAIFEERKFLRSEFAAEYAAYMRRTGRFLPKLRRASAR